MPGKIGECFQTGAVIQKHLFTISTRFQVPDLNLNVGFM